MPLEPPEMPPGSEDEARIVPATSTPTGRVTVRATAPSTSDGTVEARLADYSSPKSQ